MSNRTWFQVVAGCLLGLVLGGALIYGLVELADWIAEQTYALH